MNEDSLPALIREWARAEAQDGPSASLRPSIAAIPDAFPVRRSAPWGLFGDRRTMAILAAVLALTVVVGSALAIGSGLVPVPWQEPTRIHPGAIEPCSVVAGGPSARTQNIIAGDLVGDFEEQANSSPPRINSFEGDGCLYLATDDRGSLALFQLRDRITTTEEASDVAARLFRTGAAPFSTGPLPLTVEGHRAWVGRLAVDWDRGPSDSSYRVGLAVSAAPYFFIVVPEVDTPLDLSDGAGLLWWEHHIEPQARALAAELLARLEAS